MYAWKCYSFSLVLSLQCSTGFYVTSIHRIDTWQKETAPMNNNLLEVSFKSIFKCFHMVLKYWDTPVTSSSSPHHPESLEALLVLRVKFQDCFSPTPENTTLLSLEYGSFLQRRRSSNTSCLFQLPLAHSATLDWHLIMLILLLKDASSAMYCRHFIAKDN